MIRQLKTILILILLIFIAVLLFLYRKPIMTFLSPEKVKRTTITLLKRERMAFLVMDKLVSQIVVENTEYLPGLGRRQGFLIATVKMYYGIDLSKITADSVEIKKGEVIVHLPAPEPLDFSVDLSSLRFFTRETGMMKIAGPFLDNEEMRRELENKLYKEALFFFKKNGLLPDVSSIELRLEVLSSNISDITGFNVKFVISHLPHERGNQD